MEYLIGCDIGTSGTKTVLYDKLGKPVCEAFAPHRLFQPCDGWAEQEPDDWWEAVVQSIRSVIIESNVEPADIKGLGLSGQMHGLVMLNKEGNPIRRSIIWCDQRTKEECADITETVGAERLIKLTGNPALTGFTLSKLLWVRKREPENYCKCVKVLLPKDYIRYKLTGKFVTEVSDASGMQLLDINRRDWSDEILDKLNIDRSLLPEVIESCEPSGFVSADAALVTGLNETTVVAGGAGDQAAAAIGNGITEAGRISVTIGSSGVVFAMTDTPVYDKGGRVHTFCHAVPNKWHIMGVTQGAGLSMNWFKENFYSEEEKKEKIYKVIDESIASVPAGAEGVIYLPYLMGERTPHLDADARALFFGMGLSHGRRHLARAVMEGVSYSLKDCLDIIDECGINCSEIRAAGGGAKSSVWRQMLSDIFGKSLVMSDSAEAGALGVAILAAVASGVYNSINEAAEKMISFKLKLQSNPELYPIYKATHEKYKALYQAVKELY